MAKEQHPRIRELKYTLTRIFTNPAAIIGFSLMALFVFMAVASPYLAPPEDPDRPYQMPHEGFGPTPQAPNRSRFELTSKDIINLRRDKKLVVRLTKEDYQKLAEQFPEAEGIIKNLSTPDKEGMFIDFGKMADDQKQELAKERFGEFLKWIASPSREIWIRLTEDRYQAFLEISPDVEQSAAELSIPADKEGKYINFGRISEDLGKERFDELVQRIGISSKEVFVRFTNENHQQFLEQFPDAKGVIEEVSEPAAKILARFVRQRYQEFFGEFAQASEVIKTLLEKEPGVYISFGKLSEELGKKRFDEMVKRNGVPSDVTSNLKKELKDKRFSSKNEFVKALQAAIGVEYATQYETHIAKHAFKKAHIFGRTSRQYDIYYGIIWGTRTAFQVGIFVVGVALIIGVTLGTTAGYFGGWIDEVIMRFVDIMYAIPMLVLAMAIVVAFGRGLDKIIWALAMVQWRIYVRLLRAEILTLRERDYILAAKTMGVPDIVIMLRHILPNAIYPVLIVASLNIGSVVITAAFMSFLGLGAPPGYADWGQMVALARNYIIGPQDDPFKFWYTVVIPGVTIVLFVLAWNLIGDALRDAFDPKQRRR